MNAVILGGGPAGTAAAIRLLKAGITVTLVDKETFPRYRPGETLHPGMEPLLESLEVLVDYGCIRHPGVWSSWGEPARFLPYGASEEGAWRGFQIPRAQFDSGLLARVRELGGEILQGVAATGLLFALDGSVNGLATSQGPLAADWVLDGSGANQYVARWLGLPMERYSPRLVATFGYLRGECLAPAPSIVSDDCGWTWIAEVRELVFQWTRVTAPADRPARAWRPETLRGVDEGPRRSADVTWCVAQTLAGPGWFLTGDAAGVLDPSTSHGVLRAVMSGMMAAHAILQGKGEQCVAYHAWLSSWFEHDMAAMAEAYGKVGLFGFRDAEVPSIQYRSEGEGRPCPAQTFELWCPPADP